MDEGGLRVTRMKKILVLSGIFLFSFHPQSMSAENQSLISSAEQKVISSSEKQADYPEKYLGVIEVGETTKKILELYIGEGFTIKLPYGEITYYLDPKNNKTLIIHTDQNDVIEVVTYKNKLELPPGIKDIKQLKISSKMNIKNLMTSMGSRMGFNYMRIIGAYGRPSVESKNKNEREVKYIKAGNLNSENDFVYLEYSFKLVNNKTVEIRIENGK